MTRMQTGTAWESGTTGAEPMPLVNVRGLTKHYEKFALSGVAMRVEPGQVVGFVGKNGAGKSTTLKALLSLVNLEAGEGEVLGVPIRALGDVEGVAARQQIGVVFDALSLPESLSVAQAGKVMAAAYDEWDQGVFERLAERFGLSPTQRLMDLSRGMGMKLQLACALAHAPRLLVLDEATAGLDPMARDEVLDVLREFVAAEDGMGRPTNGVLMSSHITSDLDKLADVIVCIDEGRIAFAANKDEVTDVMGMARLREGDLARVRASGVLASGATAVEVGWPDRLAEDEATAAYAPRVLRREFELDLLVPDRLAFARRFPDIPCERLDVDGYMALMLKGELLDVSAKDGGVAGHEGNSAGHDGLVVGEE